MAEPLSRSQIILQQIENLKSAAPPPLTKEERDQIMKGRKGQKDIDDGRAAIDARAREISDHTKALNELYTKLEAAGKDEGTQKSASDAEARRQERERNANPLLNTTLPAILGAGAGAGIGEIENRILHGFNKGSAKALIEASDELGPVEKLTNSQINRARATGMAQAAEKFAPSNPLRQGGAVAGRLLSYGIPSAAFYNEYTKYHDRAEDPQATEADRLSNQQVANALLGASTGIGVDGGMRFFFPSRHEGEGKALSRGYAARDFVRRLDAADAARAAPKPTPLTPAPEQPRAPRQALPGSRDDLKQQAKRYNIKGRSKMSPDELRAAVGEAVATTKAPRGGAASKMIKGLAGPVVGGVVAADAAYNQARARGADTGEAVGDAATTGAAVGGTTAAGLYGANKLLGALPRAVGQAVGAGSTMMAPMAAADAYDPTPEQLNMDRNQIASMLPSWARFGALEDAYQMAQVPERNQQIDQEPSYPLSGAMPEAEALQVPEQMPAPEQPEPEDFDAQIADLQRIFAQLDAEDVPDPMQNAQQSRQVAQMAAPQWQAPAQQNRLLAVR